MAAEARVLLADGKSAAAAAVALDLIDLGVSNSRGGRWLHVLQGYSAMSRGLRAMDPALDRLSASESRVAIERLDAILKDYPAPAEVMETERMVALEELRPFLQQPGRLMMVGAQQPAWHDGIREWLAESFYPRQLGYRRVDAFYRAMVRELRKPVQQRVPPPLPVDWVMKDPTLNFQTYEYRMLRPLVDLRLLRTRLSLREHRLTTGRYPGRLEELPRRQGELPWLDPITDQALKYRQTANGYLLYSVGPDRRDDRGTPIPKALLGLEEAQGDLVAGKL
jgi:hypothetical protein